MTQLSNHVTTSHINPLKCKLLYVTHGSIDSSWSCTPHAHHFVELFFIKDGKGIFNIENKSHEVAANDLIIINPHTQHTEQAIAGSNFEYVVVGVEGITFFLDDSNFGIYVLDISAKEYEYILDQMKNELSRELFGCEAICHNLLEIILIKITRHTQNSFTFTESSKMGEQCAIVKKHIEYHYKEKIILDDLAEMVHINKYYLVHAFTKFTGYSPISYLNFIRIKESKELLKNTNYSISHISEALGFSSQSFFSQAFKRITGESPNKFRSTCHNNLSK